MVLTQITSGNYCLPNAAGNSNSLSRFLVNSDLPSLTKPGCNLRPHRWRLVSCFSWPPTLCNDTWVLPKEDQRRDSAEIQPREAPSADTIRGAFSATSVDLHPSPTKPSTVPCAPCTALCIKKIIKNSGTWMNIKDSQSLRQKTWIHEAFLTGAGIITKGRSSLIPLQGKKLPPEEQQSFSSARGG